MDLSFEGINLNNLNIATLASAVERGSWKRMQQLQVQYEFSSEDFELAKFLILEPNDWAIELLKLLQHAARLKAII